MTLVEWSFIVGNPSFNVVRYQWVGFIARFLKTFCFLIAVKGCCSWFYESRYGLQCKRISVTARLTKVCSLPTVSPRCRRGLAWVLCVSMILGTMR